MVFTADGSVLGIFPLSPARLAVNFPTQGLHNLQATYGGDATFPPAASPVLVEDVRLSVPADFTMNAAPQDATVKAGQSATFNLTVNPVGDLTSTVGFSCSGLPSGASCSFSPASLTPGTNPVSTTLTLTTTAQSAAVPFDTRPPALFIWPCTIAGCFSLLWLVILRGRGAARRTLVVWAAMTFILLLANCGGGSGGANPKTGTPPGTSSITVTATSATSHTTALSITVTP